MQENRSNKKSLSTKEAERKHFPTIALKKKECKTCRRCSTGATFLCFINNLKTSITETNKEATEMWSLSLLTKRQNFFTSSQGDAAELKRHDNQGHKTQHET
jgi:hypothetical protein